MTTMEHKIESILSAHNIRLVGFEETEDPFGDTVWIANPHIMDLFNCGDVDKMLKHLAEALTVKVGYKDSQNAILIKEK